MMRLLFAISVTYVLFFVYLVIFQRNFIYFPMVYSRPDISKAPFMQWIDVKTSDGLELKAWYSPPQEGKPTVIYFHGNARNIEDRMPRAIHMIRAGYGMILAEYRGYGGNPGKPTEEGLYKDARAYIEWVKQEQNLEPEDMIFYGESLGTGVAVQMATEYQSKAVILESPYNSVLAVAKRNFFMYPFLGYFLKDQYLSDQKIANINAPVLMAVAGRDFVIPARFGLKLYDAAVEPKTLKLYEDAGHVGVYAHGFDDDLIEFVEGLDKNN